MSSALDLRGALLSAVDTGTITAVRLILLHSKIDDPGLVQIFHEITEKLHLPETKNLLRVLGRAVGIPAREATLEEIRYRIEYHKF